MIWIQLFGLRARPGGGGSCDGLAGLPGRREDRRRRICQVPSAIVSTDAVWFEYVTIQKLRIKGF